MMKPDLSPRSRQILEAIVEDYIATAEPVGSSSVARRHAMSLSPATVRNVMANLEELGLLISPHTSAGRIPTEKAFRFYVDSLVSLRQVTKNEKREIIRRCRQEGTGLSEVLKATSHTLSSLSNYMGIVVAPSFSSDVFRHIEFILLAPRKILAILVSQNGTVHNRLIDTNREFNQSDLVKMGNYLNSLMQGLTIAQAKNAILSEMNKEKILYDRLLAQALEISKQAVYEAPDDIYVEGQSRILEQPEFSDVNMMREIFRTFEEKGHLLQLLNQCADAEGVHIYIGAETPLSKTAGLSLITSRFVTSSNTVGMLGVIGPTRMGYSSVIPIVDYTAKLVSKLLGGG